MKRCLLRWLLLWAAVAWGTSTEAARGVLSDDAAAHGKKLADLYCGTCHLVPAPDILDRNSWEVHALPWMAALLGIYDGFYKSNKLNAARAAGVAWTEPPLHPNDFNAIAAYYQLSAPRLLHATNAPAKIFPVTSGFRLQRRTTLASIAPSVTMVHISERDGRQFVGRETPPELSVRRGDSTGKQVIHTGAIAVSMFETPAGVYFTDIGDMTPDYGPVGKVYFVPREGDKFGTARLLLDALPRSGQISPADLNHDGRMDLLVCSFGFFGGELAWYEALPDGEHRKHVLFDRSGAVKAEARDLNGDGFTDIAVLMAQALETMFFLINDGRGGFGPEAMFNRHPAFGFSDFELVDFDGDAKLEVVTANGDFDYEGGARPYHGIRIFRGEAPMQEVYTFPMPGAYQVEVADFDGDGDQDLAAVSFTPGLATVRTPRTIFLENRGGMEFQPWELPYGNNARWFLVDSGDIDGDGDQDLLLGALYNAPGGLAPSNQDYAIAFGELPYDTLLLENVFNESRSQRLQQDRRAAIRGRSVGTHAQLLRR